VSQEHQDERTASEGERVARFLADEAVKAAIARKQEEYHQTWKAAVRPEEREAIWAKSRALDDVLLELSVTVDRGKQARAKLSTAGPASARK
jgi:hypothetical protein